MTSTLEAALDAFPRQPLLDGATPIQRLARIESSLGATAHGVGIFVKRDDHMALGGGGNKRRKRCKRPTSTLTAAIAAKATACRRPKWWPRCVFWASRRVC